MICFLQRLIIAPFRGKCADVVAIDLNAVETQPVYNPVAQVVYAAGREQVSDVWVDGEQRLNQRQCVDIDSAAILAETQRWQQKIAKH